jgi:hypothetical protein
MAVPISIKSMYSKIPSTNHQAALSAVASDEAKTNAAKVTGRSTNLEKTIGSNFNLLVFAAIAAIALLAFKGIQVQ